MNNSCQKLKLNKISFDKVREKDRIKKNYWLAVCITKIIRKSGCHYEQVNKNFTVYNTNTRIQTDYRNILLKTLYKY